MKPKPPKNVPPDPGPDPKTPPPRIDPLELVASITSHAEQQISWVRTYYGKLLTAATVLVAILIYFTYSSARDWKDEIKQDGLDAQKRMTENMVDFEHAQRRDLSNQIADMQVTLKNVSNQVFAAFSIATLHLGQQLEHLSIQSSNELADARQQYSEQIRLSLKTENIRTNIEAAVKSEAKSILAAEVQPTVDQFKADVLLNRTIARAQSFDFNAYRELVTLSQNPTNADSDLAAQAVVEIDRVLESRRYDYSDARAYAFADGVNTYRGPFTTDEIAAGFPSIVQDKYVFNREAFINQVRIMKEPLFLPHLIRFFTNETDLVVANLATVAISDLAKRDFRPRDFEQIQAWWKASHSDYPEWPVELLERAFARGFVSSADTANMFERIVLIDPKADMSRVYSLAFWLDAGDTNRAAEISKTFHLPTGRWAQLAAIRTDLSAGNVSNTTVKLLQFRTQNPLMRFTDQSFRILFPNLDWELYEKLKQSSPGK